MDVSKTRPMKLRKTSCDIKQIMEEVFLVLDHATDKKGRALTKPGVTLVNKLAKTTLPAVHADSHRCIHVFNNLLVNALTFTDKGTVTISGEVHRADNTVHIQISDTGIGIEPSHLDLIFEPFEREANTSAEGIGLGLTISREIIRNHGGEILVSSEVGRGSTFTVKLPIGDDSEPVEPVRARAQPDQTPVTKARAQPDQTTVTKARAQVDQKPVTSQPSRKDVDRSSHDDRQPSRETARPVHQQLPASTGQSHSSTSNGLPRHGDPQKDRAVAHYAGNSRALTAEDGSRIAILQDELMELRTRLREYEKTSVCMSAELQAAKQEADHAWQLWMKAVQELDNL
eukprot:TRINITY_DN15902_c0_g1_i1.p1 TRINITY_DN15902_c0_g1~~TRINITY_DN15902_c0_g1_i1.p1  ORF type:complete len:370 (+),score=45.45 TRINITY_DN15902_c0_g1_i1:84-1112(+)